MTFAALSHDLRFACRALWRAKAFTLAAVSMLSFGIAAAVTMFALVRGVLLRPLPVHEPDRLIVSWKEARGSQSARYPFGDTEIESVGRASRLLASVAGVTRNGVGRAAFEDGGEPGYVNVALVTGAFFDVLAVQPLLGRTLKPEDDREGAEHVVVLSRGLWQRRYGGSPGVIGRRVRIDDQAFTIAGVIPSDLDFPAGVEVWRTTSSVDTAGPFGDAARREVNLIARLRAGVTIQQAKSEIAAISTQLETEAPAGARQGMVTLVRGFPEMITGDVRPAMLALFAAVGLVLLIATGNVANLLLMRGEARRGELAVRAALGAGRGRIVREMLVETLTLSVLAAIAGFILARWMLQTIVTVVPDTVPRVESVRIDGIVGLFTLAIVVLVTMLAGVAPATVVLRNDLAAESRRLGRGTTAAGGARGRRILVVGQIALTVAVIAAAGLLIRSVLKLQAVDLGLPAERLVLAELHMPQARYAERGRRAQFLDDAITRLEALPAIAATPVNLSPFSGQGWDLPQFTAEGQAGHEAAGNPSLNIESVHPNYFATFQVPIVRGRPFSATDREGAPEVAIMSEDVASRTWPGGDAIGRRLKMGPPDATGSWYTIVGIAAATRYREVAGTRPTLYLPAAQFQMTAEMLVLRSAAPLELLKTLTAERVRSIDPEVRVMRVAPFTEMLARRLARPRFTAFVLGIFGLSAWLLSTIGLYAVMAAYVRQRDRELAVRLALGATPARVRRLVLEEVVRLAGVGAVLGLAAATVTNRLLRGMLFEVDPLDPVAVAGAALLMIAAAALASYLPLRRAAGLDAVAVLRAQ